MHAQTQIVCNDITQTACMYVPASMYICIHTCIHINSIYLQNLEQSCIIGYVSISLCFKYVAILDTWSVSNIFVLCNALCS